MKAGHGRSRADASDKSRGGKVPGKSHEAARTNAGNDSLAFLARLPLFQGVAKQRIAELASSMERRRYARNEVILRQGSATDEVLVIANGIVAVTRASAVTGETQSLAYLKQGEILGEVELLAGRRGHVRATATATAITRCEVLVIAGPDFMNLVQRESSTAVALARDLARRLRAANERIGTDSGMENRICLLIGNGRGAGVTTLGTALAMSLAASTRGSTAYTEYPGGSTGNGLGGQQAGFDFVRPTRGEERLPLALRATVFFDRLTLSYSNIVVGLTGRPDPSLDYILERADQVIVITSPDPGAARPLDALLARLKALLYPDRTGVYVVSNRPRPGDAGHPRPAFADFDIPYVEKLSEQARQSPQGLPDELAGVVATLADRIKRTNQVKVYIPTTIDVDSPIDTGPYVQQALHLLGELFGGATSDDAKGVWRSERERLVDETVYIITSYVTQTDLDRYLERVIDFVEELKLELKQEAVALEINEKLMLI